MQLVSCVFRTAYTKFHLDRELRFSELVMRKIGQNFGKKMVLLRFIGFLGETEPDSQTSLHEYRWATVSASKFQLPTCSGSRDTTFGSFIRLLACPARMTS